MSGAELSLFNGQPAAGLAADSRGLAYGDGVFRTALAVGDGVLNVDDQLARLADDAARLHLQMPTADSLLADSARLLASPGAAPMHRVLKWMLIRRSERRGYGSTTTAADRLVTLTPAPVYRAALWEQGAVVEWSELALAIQPRLAGIKHLNRLEQVLASRDWTQGVDERLLCDTDGQLVGGTRSNLFWVRDAMLCTPALNRCGIAGSMRAQVLRQAQALGIGVAEVDAEPAALLAADEAFLCNALLGICPLDRLQTTRGSAHQWPGDRPITRQLQQQLAHPRLTASSLD